PALEAQLGCLASALVGRKCCDQGASKTVESVVHYLTATAGGTSRLLFAHPSHCPLTISLSLRDATPLTHGFDQFHDKTFRLVDRSANEPFCRRIPDFTAYARTRASINLAIPSCSFRGLIISTRP